MESARVLLDGGLCQGLSNDYGHSEHLGTEDCFIVSMQRG